MTDFDERLRTFAAHSPLQRLDDAFPEPVGIRLFLKRDDQLHPLVSGNKWRKLKYNLLEARRQGINTLLTFGGAYSNHLYATAAAGQAFGFRAIGLVRGEELAQLPRNSTLAFCEACGMQLHFVSRSDYQRKDHPDYVAELMRQFGPCFVLPEGGTNALAIRGTAEILPELTAQLGFAPDYVCCPVGTGGTVAGLAQSASPQTQVLGFLALKSSSFEWPFPGGQPANLALITDYHGGGYARTSPALLDFIRDFERRTGVLLEQVYTGKMLFGIYDLARQGYFPQDATVVAVHTGGLQGRNDALNS
ncbi:1-aminocyclopropane-1-carboxylate deaminase/D-cysteine desulfhydrase [Spirosoma taeanense]|uniref:1-aminocyclopropane-1-carboxylate deaminase/D-cysteine desulfhydrase n=1 Tax=Spirosoma taeanense TaxID=2735870 RepID=A0A6M5YFG5_9BACT|nr:pyridoxal-phosphate dependent enzyme [Spirosoma taeanense]QJW92364.1 1-aminocyclopropane-1-carboxylate deaminase/D-cysteine desulfhydrase [Spirosoma taeanense]